MVLEPYVVKGGPEMKGGYVGLRHENHGSILTTGKVDVGYQYMRESSNGPEHLRHGIEQVAKKSSTWIHKGHSAV